MDLILINSDILNELTNFILRLSAKDEYYDINSIARMIQKLSCINKYFNNYYCDENKIKEIISFIVSHQYRINSHYGVANRLNKKGICKLVANKIKRLFDIATNHNEQFNENDLEDYWYNNATRSLSYHDITKKHYDNKHYTGVKEIHTLLSVVIETKNFNKIQQLLATKIAFNPINAIIFNKLVQRRIIKKEDKIFCFTVIQLLLAKGLGQEMIKYYLPTTLLYSILNDDEECTFLLLKYGVNPKDFPRLDNYFLDLGIDAPTTEFYYTDLNVENIVKDKKSWFTNMMNNL